MAPDGGRTGADDFYEKGASMTKAYLNALAEEGTRQDLIDWLCKLDAENDELRDEVKRLKFPPSHIEACKLENSK